MTIDPGDAYLIRDAIVGNPTDDEKRRAVAALGNMLARTGDPEDGLLDMADRDYPAPPTGDPEYRDLIPNVSELRDDYMPPTGDPTGHATEDCPQGYVDAQDTYRHGCAPPTGDPSRTNPWRSKRQHTERMMDGILPEPRCLDPFCPSWLTDPHPRHETGDPERCPGCGSFHHRVRLMRKDGAVVERCSHAWHDRERPEDVPGVHRGLDNRTTNEDGYMEWNDTPVAPEEWDALVTAYRALVEDKAASDDVIEALAARIAELEAQLRVVITTEKHATDQVATLRAAQQLAEKVAEDAWAALAAERVRGDRLREALRTVQRGGSHDVARRALEADAASIAADPEGGPTCAKCGETHLTPSGYITCEGEQTNG